MVRLAPCRGPSWRGARRPRSGSQASTIRGRSTGGRMLEGKNGLVLGVANKRSLAWAIARSCAARGAKLALTYQTPRFEDGVKELVATLPDAADTLVAQCEITSQADIESLVAAVARKWDRLDFVVHSIA